MTSRKRILFVDDEAAILASLSNLLRKDRHRWDLVFANGGPEAARQLDEAAFDIIVTDMRMPDLDGAQLLELVRKKSPHTVRIMLSGHAESEAVLRALPLVHQFISKPCDIKTLRALLERYCVPSAVTTGALPGLPSHPAHYAELVAALGDARCTIQRLVAIIERDPAMAATVLQIANTSYFGSDQPIALVPNAVATVGVEMIRELTRMHMFAPASEAAAN